MTRTVESFGRTFYMGNAEHQQYECNRCDREFCLRTSLPTPDYCPFCGVEA